MTLRPMRLPWHCDEAVNAQRRACVSAPLTIFHLPEGGERYTSITLMFDMLDLVREAYRARIADDRRPRRAAILRHVMIKGLTQGQICGRIAMPSGTLGGMAGKPRQDREVAAVFGPCLSSCSPKAFFYPVLYCA